MRFQMVYRDPCPSSSHLQQQLLLLPDEHAVWTVVRGSMTTPSCTYMWEASCRAFSVSLVGFTVLGMTTLVGWLAVHMKAAVTGLATPENAHMWPPLLTHQLLPLGQHKDPTTPREGAPARPLCCTWHVAPPSAAGGSASPSRWTGGGRRLSTRG